MNVKRSIRAREFLNSLIISSGSSGNVYLSPSIRAIRTRCPSTLMSLPQTLMDGFLPSCSLGSATSLGSFMSEEEIMPAPNGNLQSSGCYPFLTFPRVFRTLSGPYPAAGFCSLPSYERPVALGPFRSKHKNRRSWFTVLTLVHNFEVRFDDIGHLFHS